MFQQTVSNLNPEIKDSIHLSKDGKPVVAERFYNEKGTLIGMSILMDEGELPVTGEQFLQSLLLEQAK